MKRIILYIILLLGFILEFIGLIYFIITNIYDNVNSSPIIFQRLQRYYILTQIGITYGLSLIMISIVLLKK
jgi:hypothetical protein